jgi:hypothetical protein
MPHDQLLQSPQYAQAYQQHLQAGESDAQAQADAKEDIRRAAGKEAAAFTASAALPAQLVMSHVTTKLFNGGLGSTSRLGNVGRAAAAEVPANAFELGAVAAGSNVGVKNQAQPDLPLTHDVANTAVGAAIGALGMAGAHVVSPVHPAPPAVPQPVADAAAQPGNPLSRAAVAGNTGPLADAQRAQEAQEQAASQSQEQPAVDPITARAGELVQSLREPGALQLFRAEDSPISAKQVLDDLSTVQSEATPRGARERALARLNFAMDWADVQRGREPRGTVYDTQQAAGSPPATQETPAQVQQAQDAQTTPQPTHPTAPDVDRTIEALKVAPPLRNAFEAQLVRMAKGRFTPEQFQLLQQAATYPAGMSATQKIQLQQLRGVPNAGRAVAAQDVAAVNAGHGAPVIDNAPAVPDNGTPPPESITPAPVTTTPAGPGPAAFRRRRATLRQIMGMGLTRVERRDDGSYALTDGKREFRLEGPADAQLARNEYAAMVRDGAAAANTAPTEAQKQAGNYAKGHVNFDGLDISIENPVGSQRSGVGPDGKPWSVGMSAHYGYIKGTEGADGDHVDVYIADHPRTGAPVWVFDQYDLATGKFDEHKAVLGVTTPTMAERIYDAHFSDGRGPERRGAVTEMTVAEFKKWAQSARAKKPAGDSRERNLRSADNASAGRSDAGAGAVPAGGVANRGVRAGGAVAELADGAAAGKPGARNVPAESDDDLGAGSHVVVRFNGKTERVDIVQVGEEAVASALRGRAEVQQDAKARDLLQAVAALFGKRIAFFDGNREVGDGFIDPRFERTIFVATKTSINPLAVLGHETFHKMARELPDVWQHVASVVEQRVRDPRAFRENYNGKASEQAKDASALKAPELEELTSDLAGNLMSDASFWGEVMDTIQAAEPQQAKGLIARLVAFINRLVDAAVAAVRGPRYAADRFVNDLGAIRSAMRDALAEYIKANGITQQAMQSQVLRETQRSAQRGDEFEGRSAPSGDAIRLGPVTADIASGGRRATIYGWSTTDPQATREALKQLREMGARTIDVYEGDRKLWSQMLRAGLIDHIITDDGVTTHSQAREQDYSQLYRSSEREQAEPTAKILSRQDLEDALSEVRRAVPGVSFEVYDNPAEAGIPMPPGADTGTPMGVTLKRDRILLFREGLSSKLEAQRTAFHELFHRGLANALDEDDYHRAMDALYEADPEVQRRAHEWGRSPEATARLKAGTSKRAMRSLAIEEALAEMAEDVGELKVRELSALRQWLANIAEKLGLRDVAQWLRSDDSADTREFIEQVLRANAAVRDEITRSPQREPLTPEEARAAGDARKRIAVLEKLSACLA